MTMNNYIMLHGEDYQLLRNSLYEAALIAKNEGRIIEYHERMRLLAELIIQKAQIKKEIITIISNF